MNRYVKAVLVLDAVRWKREARYERVVRPLDRQRTRWRSRSRRAYGR